MNANVSKLLNEQINKEFSVTPPICISGLCTTTTPPSGLDGFENWYRVQAQVERDHAIAVLYSICRTTAEWCHSLRLSQSRSWERRQTT